MDVFAWPISAASSQTLAQISYNATHAEVKKYTAPKIPIGDDVVRVGFHHPSGTWSGVATSASNFEPHRNRKVLLHLNIEGELYHIGFRASNVQTSSKSGIGKQELGVEVVQMQQGPTPHLNKPVVLNAEGNVDAKEPEKSFLQKYDFQTGCRSLARC